MTEMAGDWRGWMIDTAAGALRALGMDPTPPVILALLQVWFPDVLWDATMPDQRRTTP